MEGEGRGLGREALHESVSMESSLTSESLSGNTSMGNMLYIIIPYISGNFQGSHKNFAGTGLNS